MVRHLSIYSYYIIFNSILVGASTSGLLWGRIGDSRGPRPLLVGAFLFLLTGYTGIRILFDAGLGEAHELSRVRLALLVMCSFFTGIGGVAGLLSAMNAAARSFPDQYHGIVLGVVTSAFGLSAFIFSSISHAFFPRNASDFLLVLGLGTSLPMVLGFFFVRPISLPSHGMATIEAGPSANYKPLSLSADSGVFQDQDSSSTRLVFQSDDDEEADVQESAPLLAPRPHALSDSVEPSSSPGLLNRRHISTPSSSRKPPSERVTEGRGVDLHRWSLWKSVDFWIVCSIHVLLAGTGAMYINNAGSIAQALLAHGNPGYDEAESSAWQAAQVSIISLANCFGRILIGIAADAVKSRVHVPRSFCIPPVSALFICALLMLIVINDVHHLWAPSGFIGFAYGCWFGLLPVICIEWFGLGTTYLNLLACTIAFALSVWAGCRDWSDWQRRLQQQASDWEAAEDAAESDELGP
ncbi:major facilitator superfamily domain-containing protein [Lactarius quietus]|nr:major facilitator superfamily domain-containing protein [Lactarius quietus]